MIRPHDHIEPGVAVSASPPLTHVVYEVEQRVATITLNRPERRNPLSTAMLRDLVAALAAARDDGEVRAVIITGAGDKAFCAGADLGGFGAEVAEVQKHLERGTFVDLFVSIERLGKPVVGCVNGHALAGGLGLALACDLLVAADTATFGTPEINVGLWPMMVMAVVTRNLSRKRAMELFLFGERIDAATALSWGLVNRVVSAAEVRVAAREMAQRLTGMSPLITRLGRDAFYAIDTMGYESALRELHAQLTLVTLTEDAREGVTAFLEKRRPEFRGR